MASFEQCIQSAREQGVLSQDEADELIYRYEQHRRASRIDEPDPDVAARTALASELEAVAARKKEIAALTLAKRDENKAYLESYRHPSTGKADAFSAVMNRLEHHGYGAKTESLKYLAESKTALAQANMYDLMAKFRKSRLSGKRFNKPLEDDVGRELFGKATGSAEAKAMADAAADTFEQLRLEFNSHGGDIGKIENWVPQKHHPQAVLAAGLEKWREDVKGWADPAKMRDPRTGEPLTPERLDETLKAAYENITTGGWSNREPAMRPFGLGALANRRNEHRFIYFKDFDSWKAYNAKYGQGALTDAIFSHIRSMAQDNAAMELFGPNPSAMIEWMKQVVASEGAKFVTGKPSLHAGGKPIGVQANADYEAWRIQSLYDYVAGRSPVSGKVATLMGDIRNVTTSAQLGSAVIPAAVQDPLIDMAARHYSGLPMAKALGAILKTFSSGLREDAGRGGLGWDEFSHVLNSEVRYAGDLGGREKTRWLAERTMNLSGLEPMTQARKHLFGLDFGAAVADRRHLSWTEFGNENAALRRAFEDYGFTEKEWDKLVTVEPFKAPGTSGWLRPWDVAQVDRRLGEKYLGMILGQTERSVPTSLASGKSLVTGATVKGTWVGELAASALQYKSFSLSLTALQLEAMMVQARGGNVGGAAIQGAALAARGAAYAVSMASVLTLAGAAAMQLKNIANGRDLQDMANVKFWIQALQYGGGLGLLGDFLFSDFSRFGHTILETLAGPTLGAVADVVNPAARNLQAFLSGEKTHVTRDALNLAGRYTPIVSSLWYTRAAYRRMVIDQLQYLTDPEAHKHFREQEQQLHRSTGQSNFWRSGEMLPNRGPELAPPPPPHRR